MYIAKNLLFDLTPEQLNRMVSKNRFHRYDSKCPRMERFTMVESCPGCGVFLPTHNGAVSGTVVEIVYDGYYPPVTRANSASWARR